jgi:hypothetical protein
VIDHDNAETIGTDLNPHHYWLDQPDRPILADDPGH